ncbi:hypothetical protein DFJ73DRAFT_891501 [Zopfochytrium polystomum]|nr:hypothetical protein DFJ73DRAFT_891501 [Zopfochytrium polystomum]
MGDDVECGAEIALHRAKCNLDCSIELHHGDKEPAQEAEAADTRPFPFVRLPAETKMQIVSLVARRQPLELARVSKAMYSDCAAVFLQWAGLPRDYRLPFKLTPLSAYLLATRFGCQRCGKVGVNRIVWELRVRACDDCLYRGTADSRRLKAIMPRELLILLPSVKVTQHPECDLRKTRTLLRKDDAREWSRKLAAGNCEWMGLSSVLAELLAERNTLKRVEEAFSKVVKCKSRWYPNRWELQPRLAEAERAYRTLWPAKLEAHLEEAIERGSDFQGLKSDIKSGWYPTTMWVRHVVESARDDVEREVAIASARTVVEQGLRAKGCGEPVPPLEEFSAWQMFRESIASGRLSEAKIAENAVPVVEIVHRTAALRAAVADGEGRKTQAYTTALHSILRRNGRGQLIECSDLQSLVEATKKAVAVEISSTKRGRKRKRAVVEAILLLLRERPVMDIPETAYTLRKRSHALQALVNSKSDDVFERNVPFWLQSTKAFRAMCNEVTTKSDASEDAFAPAMQPDQPQLVASAIISEWIIVRDSKAQSTETQNRRPADQMQVRVNGKPKVRPHLLQKLLQRPVHPSSSKVGPSAQVYGSGLTAGEGRKRAAGTWVATIFTFDLHPLVLLTFQPV